MSLHIHADVSAVAPTVLLPGDPLRAQFIAEHFLEDVVCYNRVRAMYGYTGIYKGKRISVQGTGMGIPSVAIYTHELICDYHVKNLIRVGSCGAIQHDIDLHDVIIAASASTDSDFNKKTFNAMDFAPTASFVLLKKAYDYAVGNGIKVLVGNVLTSDIFYYEDERADPLKIWRDYGTLVVEMETSALYTIASRYGVNALALLTVSDNQVKSQHATIEQREQSFTQMIEIALEIAD
jgi:purine-nucleoside phosphorylase